MSFDAWKQRLEQLEAPVKAAATPEEEKVALEHLLKAFPLLFGYWSRLAKIDSTVWPQALESAPCVQLWTEYLETHPQIEAAEEATTKIGRDFNADPIWAHYFSVVPPGEQRTAALTKLITLPLYDYAKYAELARTEGIEADQTIFEDTARGVGERWQFESRIQRNYFHVYPVEPDELKAWDEYLDYEEDQGDVDQILVVYERCLTVTALYVGFWMRYLRWLSLDIDLNWDRIQKAFASALLYHPDSSKLHTYHAQLLEVHGDLDQAGEIYRQLGSFDAFEARTQHKSQPQRWNPEQELNLWRRGECKNPHELASRLREHGYLKEFFEVDITL